MHNKLRFNLIQTTIIIAGALIPFLNTANYLPMQIRIASSLLGTLVAILVAINQFKKYESNWVQYRKTVERLKRERNLPKRHS